MKPTKKTRSRKGTSRRDYRLEMKKLSNEASQIKNEAKRIAQENKTQRVKYTQGARKARAVGSAVASNIGTTGASVAGTAYTTTRTSPADALNNTINGGIGEESEDVNTELKTGTDRFR